MRQSITMSRLYMLLLMGIGTSTLGQPYGDRPERTYAWLHWPHEAATTSLSALQHLREGFRWLQGGVLSLRMDWCDQRFQNDVPSLSASIEPEREGLQPAGRGPSRNRQLRERDASSLEGLQTPTRRIHDGRASGFGDNLEQCRQTASLEILGRCSNCR